jgi:hypothetical protein
MLELNAGPGAPAVAEKAVRRSARVWQTLGTRTRHAVAFAAAAVVVPGLLFGMLLAFLIVYLEAPTIPWLVPALAALVFFSIYLSADLNRWSLHPRHRRRVTAALSLKRVFDRSGHVVARMRDPDALVPLTKVGIEPSPRKRAGWATPIICAAVTVSGVRAEGPSTTSLTFTPKEVGGPLVGYAPTHLADWSPRNVRRDFTLPAAAAISGAAPAPVVGVHGRRALALLMTIANVRVGVWMRSPRRLHVGETPEATRARPWRHARPILLLKELFGRNSIDDPYLYAKDGSYYESLGLVELLRRGCTPIYCVDATAGTAATALGRAVSLARSELGVEIYFPDFDDLEADPVTGLAPKNTVVGTIRYPQGLTGTIVYCRAVPTPEMPLDARVLRAGNERFPHDATLDEMLDDQWFEAYRALGAAAGRAAATAIF